MSLGHSALAPSGHPIWIDMAQRSASALMALEQRHITMRDIVTDAAIRNAMVVHAAFGGSTNLILHVPAIAHAAGLRRPTAGDWADVNRQVPRLVDALPNGPRNHPTVQVFMAGGVPEVMLHLRRLGLLDTTVLTVAGVSLDAQLDAWESSERRSRLRAQLAEGRRRSGRCHCVAGGRAPAGADINRLFSARQSRAGRVGDQEHGDRSVGRSMPTACIG